VCETPTDIMMLDHQVASDSPDGATTSNSKMSELGYYRHLSINQSINFKVA